MRGSIATVYVDGERIGTGSIDHGDGYIGILGAEANVTVSDLEVCPLLETSP